MIRFWLQKNPITPDPNDCSARVQPIKVLSHDDLVKEVIKADPMRTDTNVNAVLPTFYKVLAEQIADGNHVNLPIANFRPSIIGVFTSVTDGFDTGRHMIKASISAGMLLNTALEKARVEKILQPAPMPIIIEYFDARAKVSNSIVSPGYIGTITGEELKFDGASTLEGVFFIPESGTEIKIEVISIHTDGKISFNVPSVLAPGNYHIEVRRQYKTANELRKGVLPETLRVV
jgi:hypothetical protein